LGPKDIALYVIVRKLVAFPLFFKALIKVKAMYPVIRTEVKDWAMLKGIPNYAHM